MNPSTDEVDKSFAAFIQQRQLDRQQRQDLEAKNVALTARNNELEEENKYLRGKIQKVQKIADVLYTEMERPYNNNEIVDVLSTEMERPNNNNEIVDVLSTEMERPYNDNEQYNDDNSTGIERSNTDEAESEEVSNDDEDEAEKMTQQEVYPFNGKTYTSYLEMCAAKRERNKKVIDQIGLRPLAEGLTTKSTKRKAPPVAEMAILSRKALRPLKALSDGYDDKNFDGDNVVVVDDDDDDDNNNRHAKIFGVDDADDDVDEEEEEEKADDASASIKRKAPPRAESKLRSCKEQYDCTTDVVFGNGPYRNHTGSKTYRSELKEIIDGYNSQPLYGKKKYIEAYVTSSCNQRANNDRRFYKCDKETNMKLRPLSKELIVECTLKYVQQAKKTWGK